jgi:hypothetical protein
VEGIEDYVHTIALAIEEAVDHQVEKLVNEKLTWELDEKDISLLNLGTKIVLSIDPKNRTLLLGTGGSLAFVIQPVIPNKE